MQYVQDSCAPWKILTTLTRSHDDFNKDRELRDRQPQQLKLQEASLGQLEGVVDQKCCPPRVSRLCWFECFWILKSSQNGPQKDAA